MDGVEMMDWIEEYATIREEEYQVKVEFEDPRLWQTMTFKVTPSEKCSSLKVRAAKTIGHFASKLLLFRGSHQMGDRTTLREWGVKSGDTLTIQVPEPLPSHVKVELGFEFVDYANSKLHGQDTLIFFVDFYTETIGSFRKRVAARLDCSPEMIKLEHWTYRHISETDSIMPYFSDGWGVGDCTFKCSKKWQGVGSEDEDE